MESSTKEPEIIDKSIAVLPFVNMSNDPEQEYFGDGIAEEVINVLAQVHDLRVIGRTSSFQFKGRNVDLRKIGDSLGVAYVLEGSVRKSKDQLRITAQLIKTLDGSHVWSKAFDRKADENFDVQDEIARTVSATLQASMGNQRLKGEAATSAPNPEAYDLYLQGRFFFNQRGTGLSKGLELFKQAIVLDASFASAYAGMSGCYALLTFYKFMPSLTGIKETKKWAYKAIALDPNSSEGYLFLAYAAYFLEYDWTSAEQLFQRSIELSPNVAFPRALYASYLLMVEGDAIGSEKQARKASELDPLFFLPYNALGLALMTQRKYDPGLEALQKAIDLNAKPDVVYTSLASALLQQNRSNEAVKIIEKNMSVTGRTQSMLIVLISALAKSGKMDQAMEVYGEIQEMNRRGNAEPYTLGVAATTVGRMDEAFRYFNLALEQKNSGFINWSPYNYYHPDWLQALAKDRRYQKIMDRLAFPEK